MENVRKIPPFGNSFIGSDSHHKKSIGISYFEKQNKNWKVAFLSLGLQVHHPMWSEGMIDYIEDICDFSDKNLIGLDGTRA